MSETGWTQWRVAERELAGDVDAAARELPARQAWILRALAALEAGDRAALETLMASAPREELRAVAELALSEPGSIDPTHFRARLKRVGVHNAPLPCLDLLRLACVAHSRERPTRPQKLADAARARPVLEAALMVLSPSFKAYKVEDRLLERSQRLTSYWAAGLGQHLAKGDVRGFIRAQLPGVEPLAEERWPDLEDPIGARGMRASPASLAEFLRDPIGRPWSAVCFRQAMVLRTRGGREQRLAALGGLLDAIDTMIREVSPIAAIPAVTAAIELAEASPEASRRDVLLNQLHLLHIRLLWVSGEFPMVEAVWRGLDALSPEERAQCARTILEGAEGAPMPRAIGAEVLAYAIRGGANLEREVMPWILKHGHTLDVRKFQAALNDVPVHARELALGYLHAMHHSTAEACRFAARMFERGAAKDAMLMATTAFARELQQPARGRQDRRLRARAWLEVARAAAASSPPPSAEFAIALMAVSITHSGDQQAEELLEGVLRCARARLALAPEPDQRDLVDRLQLLTAIGLDDRAHEEFRELGRWLRRSPAEAAIPAALRVCAAMCVDPKAIEGYGLDGKGPPATDGPDPRPRWLHSLTSWLDRHDTETVALHALALARDGSVAARNLALWHEDISELEDNDTWDELWAMIDDDEDLLGDLWDELDEDPR